MNQTYPRRIINFISSCVFILALLSAASVSGNLLNNFSNLTAIDKSTAIAIVVFYIYVMISLIAIFKKKKWGWVGITSMLVFKILESVYDSYFFGDYPLFIVVPMIIVLLANTIFLFSKSVLNYFQINVMLFLLPFLLAFGFLFMLTIDPIANTESGKIMIRIAIRLK